jgi:hypothetical protein
MNTRTAPLFLVVFTCLAATGCGIPRRLSDQEKSDYSSLVRAEVIVEKKSPGTAIGLGFAPFALGSIYSDQWVVLGVTDFVLWPVSILWSPVNSWSRVRETNYRATFELLGPEKVRQIGDLDRQRAAGQITGTQYIERARAIAGAPTSKP